MHIEFQNVSDEVINNYHSRGIEYALDEVSCYSSFIKWLKVHICYNPQLEAYLHYPLILLQRDFDNLINAIPDPSRPVSLQLSLIGGRRMIRRINNLAEMDEESTVAEERDNTDRVRDNWFEKYMRD
ncbi:unnamed protein product [Arabidopsis halleri]